MIRLLKLARSMAYDLLVVIALVTIPIVSVVLFFLGLRLFPMPVLFITCIATLVLLQGLAPGGNSGYGGDFSDGGDIDFDF